MANERLEEKQEPERECGMPCVFEGKKEEEISHQLLQIPRANHAAFCRTCRSLPDNARAIVFDGFEVPDPRKEYGVEKVAEMLKYARRFGFGPYRTDTPFFQKYGLFKENNKK